jgi:hypothetical protein
MRFTKAEREGIAVASRERKPEEKVLCMAPYCWGKADSAEQAIANAKKNRVKIYEGKAGWRFILFVVREDVWVDDMGAMCWKMRDKNDQTPTYREVYRSPNMPPKEVQ